MLLAVVALVALAACADPSAAGPALVEAAPAVLNRIEIGGISVRDVQALVLPDKALSGTLIGMTFLSRLSSFRVEDGALHLVR